MKNVRLSPQVNAMKNKVTLSVIIIVQNEAHKIRTCLASVADLADEIVVVDSGSSDATVAIAREFTQKVFTFEDWPGFGPQKQRAQSLATGDWVFSIDADEVVSSSLAEEIRATVNRDERHRVYAVPRATWFFGRFIRHSGWYPDYVVRLYPREKTTFDSALVHEKVVVPQDMRSQSLHSDLLHFTIDSMEQWVAKTARYARVWADERAARGRKSSLLKAVSHAVVYFLKTYFLKCGFLDGRSGLLLALLGAYSRLIKYADLWSRTRALRPLDH